MFEGLEVIYVEDDDQVRDSLVQTLELAGLPYVGAGVVGSAVGMDKVMMKRAFAACGLPIAKYASFRDGHDRVAFAGQVEAEIGYPCFAKPANLGSSVGVSKAHDRATFDAQYVSYVEKARSGSLP